MMITINELINSNDILEIQDGNHGNDHPVSSEFVESGVPFIMAKDLKEGSIKYDSCKFITKKRANDLRVGFAQPGDFILSHKGSVGFTGIVPDEYKNIVLTPQLTYYRINPKGKLLTKYLMHYFNTTKIQHLIKIWSAQSTRSYISISQQKKIPVLLPDINTQKRIILLLDYWDTLIRKTSLLIVKKQKYLNCLSHRLINYNEENNFECKIFKLKFKKIFEQYKEINIEDKHYEVLSVTKSGVIRQNQYFKKEIASEDKKKYLIVKKGMLVMSGLNFWMGAIDFQNIVDIGIVSPAYKTFRLINSEINLDYMRFFIRSQFMKRILVGSSIQGASIVRRNLDMDMLNNSFIYLPSKEKQIEIANFLLNAEKEIEILKALLQQYKNQKKGLMQKLLTGEWRVK